MSRQIIMCDIDGCLADFVLGFTTLANSIYPSVPITPTEKQPRWDGFPGMTKDQIEFVWKVVEESDGFWSKLKPIAPPMTFVDFNEINRRADLYFVTNRRGARVIKQTEDWLYKQGIHSPRVIVTERKGELARAIGATFMLDDKAGNAIYAAYHAAPKLQSFIINRPYNRFDSEVVGSKVTRISYMDEFLEPIWKTIAK